MKTTHRNVHAVTLIVLVTLGIRAISLAEDVTRDKKALAEELISLMRLSESMQSVVNERLKTEESANRKGSREEKAARRQAVEEVYNIEAFKPVWADTYVEIFTEDDLKGMIAFFKGPIGKKWIDKQREVQEKTMQRMQAFTREAESKLNHKQ